MNMRLPPVWQLLSGILDLPFLLAMACHQAVRGAQWSETADWRQRLLLLPIVGNPEQAAQTVCEPAALVRILELLVRERRLTRRKAAAP